MVNNKFVEKFNNQIYGFAIQVIDEVDLGKCFVDIDRKT